MKRYLLFVMLCVCASIGAWAGQDVTINTNGDEDYSNWGWTNYDNLGWGCPTSVTVIGKINQTGLDKINAKVATNGDNNNVVPLNLSQATLNANVTTIGSCFNRVVLPSGTDVTSYSYDNPNLKYAISIGNPTYIEVSDGVTLAEITDLTSSVLDDIKNNNKNVILSGEGANALKNELVAAGLSDSQVSAPTVSSDPVEITVASPVTAASVQAAIEALADAPAGASAKNVTVLHVTGTLTDADLTYIQTLTKLKLLDLSGAEAATAGQPTNTKLQLSPTTALVLPSNSTEEQFNSFVGDYNNTHVVSRFTSADKKLLSVFSHNETSSEPTLGNLAPMCNSQMAIRFEKWHNGSWMNFSSQMWDGISLLDALSIDFTNVNISDLGTDFSKLNPATHFVMVPTSKATKDGQAYPDFDAYTYPSTLYAASTYKNGTTSTQAYVGGQMYDAGLTTTNITYITPNCNGHLGDAREYISDYMATCTQLKLVGTITNSADLAAINNMPNKIYDFSMAEFTGDVSISSFENSNAKYIVLPNITTANQASDIVPTAYNSCNILSHCPNIYGVGQIDKAAGILYTYTTNAAESHPGEGYVYNSGSGNVEPCNVEVLTRIMKANNCPKSTESATAVPVSKLVMSGQLCDLDIRTDRGLQGVALTAYTVTNNLNEEDVTFSTATCTVTGGTSADLSKANFPDNEDMNFAAASWTGYLTQLDLPTHTDNKIIPTACFYNFKGLLELCIPYNYEEIHDGAFYGSNTWHITTTDADYNVIDNGDKTYTFSANLKQIGDDPDGAPLLSAAADGVNSPVFAPDNSRAISDVYVLATTPPVCPRGAFSNGMVVGHGGFTGGTFPYCREKYVNNGFVFTLFHYPSQPDNMDDAAYEEMEKKYTDITKKYTKKDQTGAVDGNGDPLPWPSFAELCRAWNQAIRGKIWGDWVEGDDAVNSNPRGSTKNADADELPEAGLENGIPQTGFDMKYAGWHEFVLSKASYVPTVVQAGVVEYEQAGWYTICIPYSLTEEQAIRMLGVPRSTDKLISKVGSKVYSDTEFEVPDLRQLQGVERRPGSPNKVIFSFTTKLATKGEYNYWNVKDSDPQQSATASCGAVNGQNIMMVAGYPYLIKPWLPVGEKDKIKNLGEYIMKRYNDEFKKDFSCLKVDKCWDQLGNDELETSRFSKPFEHHKVQAKLDDKDPNTPDYALHTDNTKFYYSFIGQHWDQKLPRYCFYMFNGKWYRLSSDKQYTWERYKCIIMATQQVKDNYANSGKYRDNAEGEGHSHYPTVIGKDSYGAETFDGDYKLVFLDGRDDSAFSGDNYSKYSFAFDDDIVDLEEDEVTAIMMIDGEEQPSFSDDSKIYNMSGQYMGNTIDGLSKGLYIVNGKKIVVK